jgi:hypothetical protein
MDRTSAEEDGEGWQYAGELYRSWATHRDLGLAGGYVYLFHLKEASWNLWPDSEWVSVQADFAKLPADFINDGAGTPSR